ncbi:mannosyltransferase family protein [Paraburkholderia unamae]|uniref:Mannosyltransferase PIG-V n=1 Tax=Paraburkholderia unamae TaxID=219649 RepID=A0ABX5KJY8_9BURK|nr:mannosyltransferase family protein [Paraburkholderia unamae]PVX82175.1 mannosyltransferase PIG-V [Paraburkholderia unamae]
MMPGHGRTLLLAPQGPGAAAATPVREFAFVVAVYAASRLLLVAATLIGAHLLDARGSVPELLCQFDCLWYRAIIDHGYDLAPNFGPGGPLSPFAHQHGDAANWAFFPLFPLLARWTALVTGAAPLVGAYVVSNLAFLAALLLLRQYAGRWTTPGTARFVVLLASFSPASLYFSLAYTEALYLLLMLAVVSAASSGRWLMAGMAAAALSATRNLGVTILAPMLAIAISQYGWRAVLTLRREADRAWVAMLLAPAGLAAFMLFLHHTTGDAFAFKNVQIAWHREVGNPLVQLWTALTSAQTYPLYCASVALFGIVACIWLAARSMYAEALILVTGIFIPLAAGVVSIPRYVLTLYPVPLAIGLATQNMPRTRIALLAACVALLAAACRAWLGQYWFMA